MKKLELQIEAKAEQVDLLKKMMGILVSENKKLHRKVNASGVLRLLVLNGFKFMALNVNNFARFSQYVC